MTKFLNISTDTSLGDTTPSNLIVSSQKAIKTYVDDSLIPAYKIAGRMNFSDLPQTLTEEMIGNVYSVNDPFTSDSRFISSGKPYSEGTNVVVIQTTEDITYYGYYSEDVGEIIYTLVNPYEISYGDTIYKLVSDVITSVGSVSYAETDGESYSVIYSWIDSEYGDEHYDYSVYDESYNVSEQGTTPVIKYDPLGGADNGITINSNNNYVPYRTDSHSFGNSTLLYNSSAMAFTGKLHVGSSNPSSYASKGRLTILDNSPSQNVTSLALLNYGGGGGSGVSIDLYNTSANGGIPSGRFALIDNGNYSGYLQLMVKKSGAASNPLLPALNVIPVPAANSLTTAVAFGKDEFHNVLFDLHKPEASCTITDTDKRWGGSGTSYSVTGSNKFNPRLLVAAGDIISFNNFSTEAAVVAATSSASSCAITTATSLGSVSNANISVKKAYMKITDENNNIKLLMNPYGKLGLGVSSPAYELDVAGTINASTDVKINGVSVALPIQTGNSGKYLTTNGTTASWASVDALPSQTSQSGKFLTTDGTTASWADIPEELPSQSGNSGKFLTTNGTAVSWADTPSELPSQSGQSGKVLTTNGTAVSWTSFPTVDQTYSGTSTNAQSGTAVKEAIDAAISSTYKAAGSVAFANLPTLGSTYEGYVYNVSDAFTTTADFVEGAGKSYPAGTNVVCIDVGSSTYKWDVLAGFVDLSGYQTLIDSSHKLSADLVDDTSTTNKFVTASDKTTWSGKQDQLVSGTNIKTINSTSLLGSGDIAIDGLPSQLGNSGKFLTTNGTSASWATAISSITYDSTTETLTFA